MAITMTAPRSRGNGATMGASEILFLVEDAQEGGFTARAVQASIFTEGETLDELRAAIREAVDCHFGSGADRPATIRLHYVHDETLAP